MKISTLIIIGLLGVIAYGLWRSPEAGRMPAPQAVAADPVAAMEKLVKAFPGSVHAEDGKVTPIEGVSYNVKKTDSLSAPVVGIIYFSTPFLLGKDLRYEMAYQWRDERWIYAGLACVTRDVNQPVFAGRMEDAPEIVSFVKYGQVRPEIVASRIDTREHKAAANRSTPSPGAWMHDRERGALNQQPR